MDKKPEYVLCPRCELNYFIPNKNQKYCTICLAEMNKADPNILIPEDEDSDLEVLCPVCKINYMAPDEEMCFMCAKEHKKEPEEDVDWDKIDDEPPVEDEPIEIPLDELEAQELDEEVDEEIQDEYEDDDFFDDFEDEDFDEDDEDEDEEEDDEDEDY
ncbi:MAG TPA: hypothetical protein VIL24_01850 [Clostridia bacterium]